ncbi:MAG TPA: cupredoxin domain-containing protein [Candidatus Acidoferrum sp.]|nr:cupredoxin domain-containing protein [Candidatus Acidoferrum sp.]
MKKYRIIITVVIFAIVVGGVLLLISRQPSSKPNNTQAASSGAAAIAATITYTSNGFEPASTTVKSGDTVAIKNTSDENMQFESNPHPVHTDDTDLNVGLVTPGQTKTFTVTKKGSFGFHNHLDPSDTARITIE